VDTRRILIINGHPDAAPSRLCAALSEAYAKGALACGHEVRRVCLGSLDVPLLASQAEFDTPPPAHLAALQAELHWAEHLVLVFPLWLGGAPAKLKALLEQLMRGGFGFQAEAKGMSARLSGRSARLIVTMGMPAALYRLYFGGQGVMSVERGILRLTGMSPVRDIFFGGVATASPARRRAWLDRIEKLGAKAG
jgi:putative NADPH-quinone reductase